MTFTKIKKFALILLCACPLLAGAAMASSEPVQMAHTSTAADTEAANKAKVKEFYEVFFNQRKLDRVVDFVDPKAVDHDVPAGTTMEQFKEMMGMWFTAFPDFKVTVLQIVADGDLVMCRFVQEGTFKGNLMGLAPTNKHMKLTSVDIIRIQNGKMVEHWSEWDRASFMHQLGLKPEDMAKLGM
ncbi:MAG: ester cyclase [Candidatus Sericytochromatia bacterium]